MPGGWIAGIAAVAGVALASYQAATAPGAPKSPDLAGASRGQVEAEAETLADRRRLEAAAQQGTTTEYTTAARKEKVKEQFVKVPSGKGRGGTGTKLVPYVPTDWESGGKYHDLLQQGQTSPHIVTKTRKVFKPSATQTADFTGFGEADVQGKVARQQAENILALEQKYGKQFVEEALKQQQLADPEGTAARNKLYELIQEQANAKPDRPVAQLLDEQVAEQLAAGKRLDRVSDQVLREAVQQAQSSRGQTDQAADWQDPLTSGSAGRARLGAAQDKAQSWLASGATPEDVEYRRQQQLLSNEGAFINNQTPESQFQTLSGAQQGPAPFYQGQPLPRQNQKAGPAGQTAAIQGWNMYNNAQANQVDPWIAGLSAVISGAGAAASALPGKRTQ